MNWGRGRMKRRGRWENTPTGYNDLRGAISGKYTPTRLAIVRCFLEEYMAVLMTALYCPKKFTSSSLKDTCQLYTHAIHPHKQIYDYTYT